MNIININKTNKLKMYDYYHLLTNKEMNESNITHNLTMYDDSQIYFRFFLRIIKMISTFA